MKPKHYGTFNFSGTILMRKWEMVNKLQLKFKIHIVWYSNTYTYNTKIHQKIYFDQFMNKKKKELVHQSIEDM